VAAYLLVGLAVYLAVGFAFFPGQVFGSGSMVMALLFTAILSLLFNIAAFLRQFLGKLFFRTYLTSRYHRAKEVQSIFLFIDVAGSTSLGERLEPATFFRLLNEFIYAVEQAIDLHDGLIYKYVGDCIIALWDATPRGFLWAWDAVLDIQRAVAGAQPRFAEISGGPLGFTMGLHCGPVIVGEIGQERREIGYLGDTINTTQRVQSACKQLHASILLSDAFVQGVTSAVTGGTAEAPLPEKLVRHEGVRVAGKEEPLVLHALTA
jgi:adenylate cyclase